MFDFPLLKPEQIKTAIKADYDFLHLGKVNIGIVPLHRKGVPVFFFTCLLDKRWENFPSALIGGCQGDLAHGPKTFSLFPNFPINLKDLNMNDILTLGLQTRGYEKFKKTSQNLAIHYTYCARFYKTHIPATLHEPTSESGIVTVMNTDDDSSIWPPLSYLLVTSVLQANGSHSGMPSGSILQRP